MESALCAAWPRAAEIGCYAPPAATVLPKSSGSTLQPYGRDYALRVMSGGRVDRGLLHHYLTLFWHYRVFTLLDALVELTTKPIVNRCHIYTVG